MSKKQVKLLGVYKRDKRSRLLTSRPLKRKPLTYDFGLPPHPYEKPGEYSHDLTFWIAGHIRVISSHLQRTGHPEEAEHLRDIAAELRFRDKLIVKKAIYSPEYIDYLLLVSDLMIEWLYDAQDVLAGWHLEEYDLVLPVWVEKIRRMDGELKKLRGRPVYFYI